MRCWGPEVLSPPTEHPGPPLPLLGRAGHRRKITGGFETSSLGGDGGHGEALDTLGAARGIKQGLAQGSLGRYRVTPRPKPGLFCRS